MTPIRLLAVDIDGTLLNSQSRISDVDLRALREAHARGIEVILVTGRRHAFALPIAEQRASISGSSVPMALLRGLYLGKASIAICFRLRLVASCAWPCANFAATRS